MKNFTIFMTAFCKKALGYSVLKWRCVIIILNKKAVIDDIKGHVSSTCCQETADLRIVTVLFKFGNITTIRFHFVNFNHTVFVGECSSKFVPFPYVQTRLLTLSPIIGFINLTSQLHILYKCSKIIIIILEILIFFFFLFY